MGWVQQYQGLIVALVGIGLGILGMAFRAQVLAIVQDKASAASMAQAEERLAAMERRLTTIEAAMQHLPTADQMTALSLAISDLRGDVKGLAAKVGGVETLLSAVARKVELMDEHMKRAA